MRHHVPTAIVMLVVGGILLGLNLVAWRYHLTVPTHPQLGDIWYGYGWPLPFARQLAPNLFAALTQELRSLPFTINLGVALFMTVGSGWICECWMELRVLTGSFRVRIPAPQRK